MNKKVVSIQIKGKTVFVKGESNKDIAEQLTNNYKGHYSDYMVKKSADVVEEHPAFTLDHDKGIWDSQGVKLN